jgi:hypothetical protein
LACAQSRDNLSAEMLRPRLYRLILGLALLWLAACGGLTDRTSTSGTGVDGVVTRPPPPIVASHCAGLSAEERREAAGYVSRITYATPTYWPDPRLTSGHSAVLTGVSLYMPAERAISRAYLERLLSCHAIQPAQASDHPNDPLLAPGITSVDVVDADGGQYRITISVQHRRDAEHILQRTRALRQSSGTVRVQQVDSAP